MTEKSLDSETIPLYMYRTATPAVHAVNSCLFLFTSNPMLICARYVIYKQ